MTKTFFLCLAISVEVFLGGCADQTTNATRANTAGTTGTSPSMTGGAGVGGGGGVNYPIKNLP